MIVGCKGTKSLFIFFASAQRKIPLLCRFDERTSAEKSLLWLCRVMRTRRRSRQRVAVGRGSRFSIWLFIFWYNYPALRAPLLKKEGEYSRAPARGTSGRSGKKWRGLPRKRENSACPMASKRLTFMEKKGAHPLTENRPLYNWCYPRYGAAKIQLFSVLSLNVILNDKPSMYSAEKTIYYRLFHPENAHEFCLIIAVMLNRGFFPA